MIQTENNELALKHGCFQVASGIWGMKDKFVNFYMIHDAPSGNWVLIDAGLKTSRSKIKKMAKDLFGEQSPSAIILTHGHFDHVGAVESLANEWNVPVYAHYLEFPYLSGISSYPPPDPSVGGGMMSVLSVLYPCDPIDISGSLVALPEDNTVPFLEGWEWHHTPGHAPGHVSLFRKDGKILIAGDAFVTTKQESFISTVTQREKLSGPPMYFTYDWEAAGDSVRILADLEPEVVATGHGKPMRGQEMRNKLQELANDFFELAVPHHGRYIDDPAVADASGTLYVPPKSTDNVVKWAKLGGILIAGIAAFALVRMARRDRSWY